MDFCGDLGILTAEPKMCSMHFRADDMKQTTKYVRLRSGALPYQQPQGQHILIEKRLVIVLLCTICSCTFPVIVHIV